MRHGDVILTLQWRHGSSASVCFLSFPRAGTGVWDRNNGNSNLVWEKEFAQTGKTAETPIWCTRNHYLTLPRHNMWSVYNYRLNRKPCTWLSNEVMLPKSDPQDEFFYLTLTLMIGSCNLGQGSYRIKKIEFKDYSRTFFHFSRIQFHQLFKSRIHLEYAKLFSHSIL